jgi:thiol:disulfide interchange protein
MRGWPKIIGCILFFAITAALFAQESPSPPAWKVDLTKSGLAGKYEVVFSTTLAAGWELYVPQQQLFDQPAASLQWGDSSVIFIKSLHQLGSGRRFSSELLGQEVETQTGKISWSATIQMQGPAPAFLQGTLFFTYGKGEEIYPATTWIFSVPVAAGSSPQTLKKVSIDLQHPVLACGDTGTAKQRPWQIFLLGLLGGLIALLTPCVFPMIPVTVTFFTKKSTSKKRGRLNALLYGSFIFLIYVLLTLPFHVAGKAISPEIFNNISTNVWLNLLFFIIFIVFALSFFGLYEIGLPAGFANRMDAKSSIGNVGGIFFMATTLAIVSFSCTGPILGTLLVGVAEQGAWPLTAGAAGFGLALGLPFGLFALFPHWLQSLPRSGGWMTDVKVVLGFIELALAIKFLSNADLVAQWGLLKREVFLLCWILIGTLTTLYVAGKLRIGGSGATIRYSISRIFFLLLFASFTIYLLPGLTKTKWAELRLISGFPPPMSYSLFENKQVNKRVFKPLHNEYERALQLAKETGKPVLIDFTGWACVNCRRMEEKVWTDPRVDSLLRNAFVVVSLYVDEKVKLPATEQQLVQMPDSSTKLIETVGDKWASFQVQNFGATSQPQYVIINTAEQLLNRPKFYSPNPDEFIKWLTCGLEAFQQKK